ncbi:OsmC family protein [Pectobacteriaceae bacterium CE90]|nr:OsmC family protein [Pectobacteriaceae bacterium CE90]
MHHNYISHIVWTGNRGEGTVHYRGYDRTWNIAVPGKAVIQCSNDPLLGGDATKMNPEDLLISSLSACHMLWYLHYASDEKIVVTQYEDNPVGIGEVETGGAGRFVSVTLKPKVTLRSRSNEELATSIHDRIHKVCFIARSVNFPVFCEPKFVFES